MKTLSDIFQDYAFDYDLLESELFGTVGLLFTANGLGTFNLVNEEHKAVLKHYGAEELHFCFYVPHMTDEDVLALTGTGTPLQSIYPSIIPVEVADKFVRAKRSWFSNYCHDLFEKADFRAPRLEILVFGLCLLALNQLLERAF